MMTDLWFADDFAVRDQNRRTVAVCSDADTAEQIAAEHNAHAGLVSALREIGRSDAMHAHSIAFGALSKLRS